MSKNLTFNRQSNKAEYNNLVMASPQGTVFVNTKFLDSFKINYSLWNVKQGSEIKAVVCLITDFKKKNIIFNDFVIYSGIMFNLNENRLVTKKRSDEYKITEFAIANITKIYSNIEIQLPPEFEDIRPIQWFNYKKKTRRKFNIQIRYTTYLSFNNENLTNFVQTKLYNNMETVRRYDYRQAIKNEAKIIESNDLKKFLKFYNHLMAKQKIKISTSKLKSLGNSLSLIIKKKIGSLYYVDNKKGETLYALFYIGDNKKAYYFLGAGNPAKSTSWQSIFGHCEIFKLLQTEKNIDTVDLEGVNSPTRGWFKLSMGGNLKNYYLINIKK